jgi:hypothetical protein
VICPRTKAPCEQGRAQHGRDFGRLQSTVEPRPVTKRDAAWERIKAKAEEIRKANPLGQKSFAQCVDLVLRQKPELYEQYRNS